jgi:hypothetical protein
MRAFSDGSEMAQKVQGCLLAPEGALPAAAIRASMVASDTVASLKKRTDRLLDQFSYTAWARRSTSWGGIGSGR